MITRTSNLTYLGFIILMIAAIGGVFWMNLKLSSQLTDGGDFYIYWYGTRALLVDGLSPYSEAVISSIETSLADSKLSIYIEGSLISMPLYAMIITLPFAIIEDFKLAQAFWMTAQEIALVVLILMMLKITNWRPRRLLFTSLMIAIFFSIFALVVFISGNMIIWTSLFLVLALGALKAERDEFAGGMLTLTTFQPHIFIFSYIFILAWGILNKKYGFVAWFFGLLLIMTIIGIFLITDWPIQYLRVVLDALDNSAFTSTREVFVERWPGIGIQLSWMLTIISTVILIVEWWIARFSRYRWFLWTVCLTLVLSRVIGSPIHLIHNVILFIPLVTVFSVIDERWKIAGSWINAVILMGILIGGWFIFLNNVFTLHENLNESLLFAFPTLLLIVLYWVRWWAIRDQGIQIQGILSRG